DLKELADFLQKISQTGAQLFPNMELEKTIMKLAGLPAPIDVQTSGEGPNAPPHTPPAPQRVVQIDPSEDMQDPEPGSPQGGNDPKNDINARARVTRGRISSDPGTTRALPQP